MFSVLRNHNAALCIADFGDKTTPLVQTASHGYFRLRDEGYTPEDIAGWAQRIREATTQCKEVYVYFKHEEAGLGPQFAKVFLDALGAQ